MRSRLLILVTLLAAFVTAGGCSGGGDDDDEIDDEATVQDIVANILPTIIRITTAGLAARDDGASGASINEVVLDGLVSGTAAIGGSIANSSGNNQTLNLFVGMTEYADTSAMNFTTDNSSDTTKLQFDLNIQNQPADNGMTGILAGAITVGGSVVGTGVFDLDLVSDLEDDDGNPAIICTHVTGTVAVPDTTLNVNFVLPLGLDSALEATCMGL